MSEAAIKMKGTNQVTVEPEGTADTLTQCHESRSGHGGRREGAGRKSGSGFKTVDMAKYKRLADDRKAFGGSFKSIAAKLKVSARTLRRRIQQAARDEQVGD